MICVNRGYRHVSASVTVALFLGLALAIPTTAAQEKLTDLKSLAGTWSTEIQLPNGGAGSFLLTIKDDGTYSRVATIRGGNISNNRMESITGAVELGDGTAQYKTLLVDAKGNRALKVVRSDGVMGVFNQEK